jgi:hypothetical protein
MGFAIREKMMRKHGCYGSNEPMMLVLRAKIWRIFLRVLSAGVLTLVLVVSGLAQEKAGTEQPIPPVKKQPEAEKHQGVKMPEREDGRPRIGESYPGSPASPKKTRAMRKRTDGIGGQVIRAKEGEEEGGNK